jgi:hypothetical protein
MFRVSNCFICTSSSRTTGMLEAGHEFEFRSENIRSYVTGFTVQIMHFLITTCSSVDAQRLQNYK